MSLIKTIPGEMPPWRLVQIHPSRESKHQGTAGDERSQCAVSTQTQPRHGNGPESDGGLCKWLSNKVCTNDRVQK